jgi:lantibiotic modifying enzyme
MVSRDARSVDASVPLSTWSPVLDGEARRAVLDVVGEIARASVAGDRADDAGGLATLLVYAGHAGLDIGDDELAADRLDSAVASLKGGYAAGLWGGLAGIGWTIAHLAGGDEAAELCALIDAELERRLDVPVWESDYDLIGGLVGIGVGALERIDAPAAQRIAARVLDHLEAAARQDGHGLAWHSPAWLLPAWQREISPDGHYDLGLAHGVPGVIGLMAGFLASGFEPARSRRLLDGAVAWLRALAAPGSWARFPAVYRPGIHAEPTRLAWCYGDAGVAVTLLAAARVTSDLVLEAEVIAMGHAMAARSFESSGVRDTGICHGAAGVAHIFNRMYQATGDTILGAAARVWIDRLLQMRRAGEPVAGFPSLRPEAGVETWVADGGVLTGASGVALVLLAAATDVEPCWDRALLLDIPGAS